mgnify:CR=1 FL=1
MSIRETTAKNIVTTLQEIADLKPGLVTREPFDVEKIAITQFPAILIESTSEERITVNMGPTGKRTGTIEYIIRGFVRGVELDSKRNDLIEAIEEALDADRNRGQYGIVLDTQITKIEIIKRLPPLAEIQLTVEVKYIFTRGTT